MPPTLNRLPIQGLHYPLLPSSSSACRFHPVYKKGTLNALAQAAGASYACMSKVLSGTHVILPPIELQKPVWLEIYQPTMRCYRCCPNRVDSMIFNTMGDLWSRPTTARFDARRVQKNMGIGVNRKSTSRSTQGTKGKDSDVRKFNDELNNTDHGGVA